MVEKELIFSPKLVTSTNLNSGENPMELKLACHWEDVVRFRLLFYI